MRFLIILILSSQILSNIKLEDIDFFNSISDPNSESIILNGTSYCNNFFSKKIGAVPNNNKFKNIFLCKFSKKRNRFYIYMLSVQKNENNSLKEVCVDVLKKWPIVFDHMDKKLQYQKKEYLQGFYVENFFYDKVVSFSNNYVLDQKLIQDEIDNFILKNRYNFTENNKQNNLLVSKEINKIKKIYEKVISNSISDLDLIIKSQLDKIVRYKVFVNDVKSFKSYSCNWQPSKGIIPYIKREKFNEFENI